MDWPDWIKYQVFSSLDFKDLYRCERVCRDWNEYLSSREEGRLVYREANFREVLGAPFHFIDKEKLHLESLALAARRSEPALSELLLELKAEKDGAEARSRGGGQNEQMGGEGREGDSHLLRIRTRGFLKRFYSHNGSLMWPWVLRFNQFKLNLKRELLSGDAKVFFAIGSHEFEFASADAEGFQWRCNEHGYSAGLEYHAHLPEKWRYACDLLRPHAGGTGKQNSITFGFQGREGKYTKLLDSEGHMFLAGFGNAGEYYQMALCGSDGHLEWDPVSWDCECTGFTVQRTKLTAYCHLMEIDPADLSLVCSPSFTTHWKETSFLVKQQKNDQSRSRSRPTMLSDQYSAREILQGCASIKLSFTVYNRHYMVELDQAREKDDLPFDSLLGYTTRKRYTWTDAQGWDKYGEDWGSVDLCIMTGKGGSTFKENILLVGRTCVEIPFGQRIGNKFEVKQLFWLKNSNSKVKPRVGDAVQNVVKDYNLFEVVHHFMYDEKTKIVSDHVVRMTDATMFVQCVQESNFHNFMVGE
jgi:hypothetical protein